MKYISTRGHVQRANASLAILTGIAPDGGLYVPEIIPGIDRKLEELITLDYRSLAYEILKLYLTDFSEEELHRCIEEAYSDKFDTPEIAPLVSCNGGKDFLELFHGRTLAFKDMALSILPHLMKISAKKNNMEKRIIILTATSGDTGKAALEGFADVDNMAICVFYPKDGVSEIQKLQMITQEGANTFVVGLRNGNFDDAQTGVKKIFTDAAFGKELSELNCVLSSANSINIGRLLPQIVYYFYAYGRLVLRGRIKAGEKINFTVPTGNFGNILAGYYAGEMGLPINKLICASNDNKALYDYFSTGEYNRNREFFLTASPSMDILISSNLERLLYHNSNSQKTKELMNGLAESGKFSFRTSSNVLGEYATDAEAAAAIRNVYHTNGYVMDPHTAVADAAYEKYLAKTGDSSVNVIVSTASPYKFPESVCSALDEKYKNQDSFTLFDELSRLSGVKIPAQIKELSEKPVRHETQCVASEMKKTLEEWLAKKL